MPISIIPPAPGLPARKKRKTRLPAVPAGPSFHWDQNRPPTWVSQASEGGGLGFGGATGEPGWEAPTTTSTGGGTKPPGKSGFWGEIESDPMYGLAVKTRDKAIADARDSLGAMLQQLAISSGFDPTESMTGKELADYGDFIDANTRALAAKNPFSARAQLGATRNVERGNLRSLLAARGILRSGAENTGRSV